MIMWAGLVLVGALGSFLAWRKWLRNNYPSVVLKMLWAVVTSGHKLGKVRALYAQSALETGWFQSNLCVNHGNYFGMGAAHAREQDRVGTVVLAGVEYATYKGCVQSTRDRLAWDKFAGIVWNGNEQSYFEQVKAKGYATDPEYVSKCVAIYRQANVGAAVTTVMVGVWLVVGSLTVALVVGGTWLWKRRHRWRRGWR